MALCASAPRLHPNQVSQSSFFQIPTTQRHNWPNLMTSLTTKKVGGNSSSSAAKGQIVVTFCVLVIKWCVLDPDMFEVEE